MYKFFFKRLLDIIIGLIALPFVLLVILCCSPFIWLTDKGPVFYNAKRVGKDCKPFTMYKLRSMYVNSPDLKNVDGSTFNSDDDPRVTPFGRLLRKTSLDEFPQFLNILKGDMSLIGPRPKLFNPGRDYSHLDGDIEKSFSVKPGVTGYAQAYYRNSITQDEKFHWDAYYADNLSLMMDIKILLMTVYSVIARKNINTVEGHKVEK